MLMPVMDPFMGHMPFMGPFSGGQPMTNGQQPVFQLVQASMMPMRQMQQMPMQSAGNAYGPIHAMQGAPGQDIQIHYAGPKPFGNQNLGQPNPYGR